MAALAVRRRAAGDLHQERRAAVREIPQDRGIEDRAEIVGVGNEGIFHALGEQPVQPAAADQRRIEIAVTRRAPFVIRDPPASSTGSSVAASIFGIWFCISSTSAASARPSAR